MSTTKIFYTYIVECADGTYYTGKTTDLKRRVEQHNGLLRGGAKYTRIRRPVILRYFEEHPTNSDASKKEYQLKTLPREKKIELCTAELVNQL